MEIVQCNNNAFISQHTLSFIIKGAQFDSITKKSLENRKSSQKESTSKDPHLRIHVQESTSKDHPVWKRFENLRPDSSVRESSLEIETISSASETTFGKISSYETSNQSFNKQSCLPIVGTHIQVD